MGHWLRCEVWRVTLRGSRNLSFNSCWCGIHLMIRWHVHVALRLDLRAAGILQCGESGGRLLPLTSPPTKAPASKWIEAIELRVEIGRGYLRYHGLGDGGWGWSRLNKEIMRWWLGLRLWLRLRLRRVNGWCRRVV